MTKVIGLTGGIGSGKSTVARLFADLGVPIYIADQRAKQLMNTSKVIKRELIALFGTKAYNTDGLDRNFIASKIFNNKDLLQKMNAIVHPKVGADFKRWLKQQKTSYVIKEAAIIFEHNQQSQFDYIITVTTPIDERLQRVMKRDNKTKEQVMAVVNNQLSDKEKIKQSHFVIVNQQLDETKTQVEILHQKLLKLTATI
uniref:dephospho-CoA kinase n=1 Tax=Gelidibacter sp. TaxID=2018083 RepID=UPI00404A8C26